jgi:hypothetical protein
MKPMQLSLENRRQKFLKTVNEHHRLLIFYRGLFYVISTLPLLMFFDYFVTSFVHEIGHALMCSIVGVSGVRIEWHHTFYVGQVTPYEKTLIAFSGGAFAAIILFLVYIELALSDSREAPGASMTKHRIAKIMASRLLLASVLLQLAVSILEGFFPGVYAAANNEWAILAFSLMSVLISAPAGRLLARVLN